MNNKFLVPIVVGIAIVIFVVSAFFFNQKQKVQQTQTLISGSAQLIRDHSPSLGSPLFRVTLVEFLDPECESCRVFHPYVKNILKKYDGRIHYVVRYAPFHRHSKEAVAFLEAARLQGKYWATLDLLFERQPQWADHHKPQPELKWTYLKELGLDETQMRKDVESEHIKEIIEIDIEDGRKLQISGTPSFFINGSPLERFNPDFLDQVIQQTLGE